MTIWDSVMANDELDMLEMRLTELEPIANLVHVVVEADVDHQDHPKPYWITENVERFAPWRDRLRIVRASGLPTAAEAPDPWAREHAQREYAALGMADASSGDVILHGDLDEIPTVLAARNVKPQGFVAFDQRMHCFAVDWLHPQRWCGTVAARVGSVRSFSQMRDSRNIAKSLPNAGWHFSWLGGKDAALRKLGSFCHPEIADRTLAGIEGDMFVDAGYHVDGIRQEAVEVDGTYPRYIREGKAPANWYRPRGERLRWAPPMGGEANGRY